jgi:hypothetical protein
MPTPMGEYTQIRDAFLGLCKGYKTQTQQAKQLEERIEMSKKDVILKLRDCLIKQAEQDKKPIEPEKISAEIAKDLKEYVTSDYIRKCLGSEFKDQSKVREKKPMVVTTEGSTQHQEEPPTTITPPPRGETTAEMNQRLRANWRDNPYAKLTKSAGAKQEKAYKKKDEEQERKSGAYTGPSIGPKEEVVEEEQETSYFITITDTDIIDEIVLLRTQQNVMRIRLEVDAADRTVMGIRQNR